MDEIGHDGADRDLTHLERIETAFAEDSAEKETELVRGGDVRRTLPKCADETAVFKDAAEDLSVSYIQAKNHQSPPQNIVGSGQWAVKRSRLPTTHCPLFIVVDFHCFC